MPWNYITQVRKTSCSTLSSLKSEGDKANPLSWIFIRLDDEQTNKIKQKNDHTLT